MSWWFGQEEPEASSFLVAFQLSSVAIPACQFSLLLTSNSDASLYTLFISSFISNHALWTQLVLTHTMPRTFQSLQVQAKFQFGWSLRWTTFEHDSVGSSASKTTSFRSFPFNSNHSNSTTETETEKKKEHKGEGKSISQVQHRKGWKVEFKKFLKYSEDGWLFFWFKVVSFTMENSHCQFVHWVGFYFFCFRQTLGGSIYVSTRWVEAVSLDCLLGISFWFSSFDSSPPHPQALTPQLTLVGWISMEAQLPRSLTLLWRMMIHGI